MTDLHGWRPIPAPPPAQPPTVSLVSITTSPAGSCSDRPSPSVLSLRIPLFNQRQPQTLRIRSPSRRILYLTRNDCDSAPLRLVSLLSKDAAEFRSALRIVASPRLSTSIQWCHFRFLTRSPKATESFCDLPAASELLRVNIKVSTASLWTAGRTTTS